MVDSDDFPPLPNERSAPEVARAGCIAACGLALLVLLYVGSYIYLVADVYNGWGLTTSMDEETIDRLEFVYAPLIWIFVWIQGR